MTKIDYLLKWAGSKRSVAADIIRHFPHPDTISHYIEPFVGSGAVFLNVAHNAWTYSINDINADLMSVWYESLYNQAEFEKQVNRAWNNYENTSAGYNQLRLTFNRTPLRNMARAAAFLWLNRHCFNGLCRYNSKGEFNTPYGKYKSPKCPTIPKINRPVTTHNMGYRAYFGHYTFGRYDLLYVDPPYVKVNAGSFTGYAGQQWTSDDDETLANTLLEIKRETGAHIFVSNSFTERTRELYTGATQFHLIPTRRSIAANGEKRGQVNDYLIEL